MNQFSTRIVMILAIGLMSSPAVSQEKDNAKAKDVAPDIVEMPDREKTLDQGSDNREMAKAVTGMARTCELMMQRGTRFYPWAMGAAATIAALSIVALVLLVVLQVQWIRHWNHRLQQKV